MKKPEPIAYFRKRWEPAPPWVWLAAGVMLAGLVAALGVYLFFFDLPDGL